MHGVSKWHPLGWQLLHRDIFTGKGLEKNIYRTNGGGRCYSMPQSLLGSRKGYNLIPAHGFNNTNKNYFLI